MAMNRRKFFLSGWKAGGALLGVAAARTSWALLQPLKSLASSGKFKLKDAENYKPGTAEYITAARVWVVNPGDGKLLALSQTCPHLGCRVPFCESSGRFECPCHGSTYNIGGEYIKGPAPRGMDRFPILVENGGSFVDTTKVVRGPNHGSHVYPSDSKGPSCKEA